MAVAEENSEKVGMQGILDRLKESGEEKDKVSVEDIHQSIVGLPADENSSCRFMCSPVCSGVFFSSACRRRKLPDACSSSANSVLSTWPRPSPKRSGRCAKSAG